MPADAPDWFSVDLFKQTYLSQLVAKHGGGTITAETYQIEIADVSNQGELIKLLFTATHPDIYLVVAVEGTSGFVFYCQLPAIGSAGGYVDLSFNSLRDYGSDNTIFKLTKYDEANNDYQMALVTPVPFYSRLYISGNASPSEAGETFDYKLVYRTFT